MYFMAFQSTIHPIKVGRAAKMRSFHWDKRYPHGQMAESAMTTSEESSKHLLSLAIGGIAVGTGTNAQRGMTKRCVEK